MITAGVGQDAIRFLAQHFVSLTWQDRTPASRGGTTNPLGSHMAASGVVVSVRGEWFLLTAGHVLARIDEARRRGQILDQWQLDDAWSWKAKVIEGGGPENIPFGFDDASKTYIFDEESGADYGLIHIDSFLTVTLRAHGIEPIDEASWRARWPTSFEGYLLMGIPTQLVTELPGGARVEKDLVVVGVRLDENPPEILRKPYLRWYGRIIPSLPLEVLGKRFDDIDGMSGGPLFAFNTATDGRGMYWILGVQSGWVPSVQAIAVCPLQEFLWVFDRRLANIIPERAE